MKKTLIVALVSIILLGACGSAPANKTQYYLLNSPTATGAVNTDNRHNNNRQPLGITLLALPDYLRQPSLVLQLSSHQLHYSHFHMWAEPLQNSFTQALAQDLNNIDSHFHYIVTPVKNQATAATAVVINITAFHATHQSQALLSGTYWLPDKNGQNLGKAHNFTLTVALNENGYEHAVEQMRKVITSLAQKITDSLVVE
ncbi:membrane integrity-associated transporter subunit PqiC [Colwellia sp. MB3u-70]|uniref:PqiC family protein n=1 Tax=unclassified Colwellia TaxID=196834 RepID=UPI0015F3A1C3|nr:MULTISPECIES: PqiC family protein [unclassified Colwellia]MBA6290961.1 membrane integrity-associated transporter subunit PqiC [Colwellia sp. MB3u-8]MBA6306350.1 membrane integrity-associated transporter subunit PqiC [Colwellia sp. MB3u-70]